MSLRNRVVAFAVALAALGVVLLASQFLGHKVSMIASAVWGA
jgi:hypothetical protein